MRQLLEYPTRSIIAAPGGQKKGPASSSGDDCVVDKHGSRGVWRPSNRPTDQGACCIPSRRSAAVCARHAIIAQATQGPRNIAFATACEAYSVLRPRNGCSARCCPCFKSSRLRRVEGLLSACIYAADLRIGNGTRRRIRAGVGANGVKANRRWEQALNAGPLSYNKHWKAFEAMLYDCKESITNDGRPCFNWRTPHFGKAPDINDAAQCAVERLKAANPSTLLPAKKGGSSSSQKHQVCLDVTPKSSCLWSLPMPSNGTLAAVVECSHRFDRSGRSEDVATYGASLSWATRRIQLSASLVAGITRQGRAHERCGRRRAHNIHRLGRMRPCVHRGTVDPQGGWTRAMIDYYIGGLTDGFVSSLFSSFVGAVLRRSLTCCSERFHFGAMYCSSARTGTSRCATSISCAR